jgi:hypothetical protein
MLQLEALSDALNNSKWYQIENVQVRKEFLFLMLQSQRDFKLKAVGIIPLTIQCFTNVS